MFGFEVEDFTFFKFSKSPSFTVLFFFLSPFHLTSSRTTWPLPITQVTLQIVHGNRLRHRMHIMIMINHQIKARRISTANNRDGIHSSKRPIGPNSCNLIGPIALLNVPNLRTWMLYLQTLSTWSPMEHSEWWSKRNSTQCSRRTIISISIIKQARPRRFREWFSINIANTSCNGPSTHRQQRAIWEWVSFEWSTNMCSHLLLSFPMDALGTRDSMNAIEWTVPTMSTDIALRTWIGGGNLNANKSQRRDSWSMSEYGSDAMYGSITFNEWTYKIQVFLLRILTKALRTSAHYWHFAICTMLSPSGIVLSILISAYSLIIEILSFCCHFLVVDNYVKQCSSVRIGAYPDYLFIIMTFNGILYLVVSLRGLVNLIYSTRSVHWTAYVRFQLCSCLQLSDS